ncbi:hypothetical protein [Lusitaniella coriacea]|uniref:hypothetical protein n=1 Tax=Lusitaniella coriacea TaxID=1983105 RepID=UPI003CF6C864
MSHFFLQLFSYHLNSHQFSVVQGRVLQISHQPLAIVVAQTRPTQIRYYTCIFDRNLFLKCAIAYENLPLFPLLASQLLFPAKQI